MAQIIPESKRDKKVSDFIGTGKRKTAVARVRIRPGQGNWKINDKGLEEYFGGRVNLHDIAKQAFNATNLLGKYDASISVHGGGVSAQAEAVRHGIARALLTINPEHRKALKSQGLLTRDAREKERRKVGRRKARRRPQYSKR